MKPRSPAAAWGLASLLADPVQEEDSGRDQEAQCLGKRVQLRGSEPAALASGEWQPRDHTCREHRAQVQQDVAQSLPTLGLESDDSCTYWLWDLSKLHDPSVPQLPRLPEGTVTLRCEAQVRSHVKMGRTCPGSSGNPWPV